MNFFENIQREDSFKLKSGILQALLTEAGRSII